MIQGVFVVTVPALSISTYGQTQEEALEKARETILVTVEGLQAAGQPVSEGDMGKLEVAEVTP